MKGLATALLATLALHAIGCSSPTPLSVLDAGPCLERPGPLVALTGEQAVYEQRKLSDGTRIDARAASWLGEGDKPVQFGGTSPCWLGGRIEGTFSDTTSWETMHGTYGILAFGPGILVEDVRIHNYGDGVSLSSETAANWVIRGSHFSYVRDDCIENDFLNSGLVDDTFYDGCYNGYSARAYGGFQRDGSNNVVMIRHTLMRLQPMPTVYAGPVPGHALFFKLDKGGLSPRMILRDNIFRVDQLPSTGSPSSGQYFVPPPEKLASCSNNVIVWLVPSDFPEPLPECYTLTRDVSVWDRAASAWLAEHPAVQ